MVDVVSATLRLTPTELLDLRARVAHRPTLAQMRDTPAVREKRGQKYGNTKVVYRGIKFDSKAEHRRWVYLSMLERAGEIRDLRLQVPFVLIPKLALKRGGKQRETTYIADFTYTDSDGQSVVEDVKGAITPEFRLKRKLMAWVHSIEVQEIRS